MEHSKEVWLIRHGETEWSRSGKHTGRTEVDLTETGERRARALGEILASKTFGLVLTSPLRRARETCRLAGFADQARPMAELVEWDYGIFEGRTTAEIRVERPQWSVWDGEIPEGETIEHVAQRARMVIEDVLAAPGDAALFSHGHILRILAACWLGLPPVSGKLLALDTGSVSVLGYERSTRVLRGWNRTV